MTLLFPLTQPSPFGEGFFPAFMKSVFEFTHLFNLLP